MNDSAPLSDDAITYQDVGAMIASISARIFSMTSGSGRSARVI
jgi:hypothetical protein